MNIPVISINKLDFQDNDIPKKIGQACEEFGFFAIKGHKICLLYTSPSPRDQRGSRMPSSA